LLDTPLGSTRRYDIHAGRGRAIGTDRRKRADQQERKKLPDEVRPYILDSYIMIPVLRQALIHGVGPRIANTMGDIEGAIPQYVYTGSWEDVQSKEG
jgi:hypothetical protein